MAVNILILSAGTRNKVVQYFRKTLAGKGSVVATDMSTLAPAIYEADKYYIVPSMHDATYVDVILDICRKESISGVLYAMLVFAYSAYEVMIGKPISVQSLIQSFLFGGTVVPLGWYLQASFICECGQQDGVAERINHAGIAAGYH